MKRPEESGEEEEDEEEWELVDDPKEVYTIEVLLEIPTEGQIAAKGLVEDNAPATEKDPQISYAATTDQGKDNVPPPEA